MAHSLIGASSAHRWMACPGSVRLQRELIASGVDLNTTSAAAEEGTLAHALLAECLTSDRDTWEFADDPQYPAEMLGHVQTTLGALRDMGPGQTFVEQHVALEGLHPDAFGTVDFGHFAAGVLSVVDFKYGKGLAVAPQDNPQLLYYARGLMSSVECVTVRVGIIQPRRGNPNIQWADPITADDLVGWSDGLAHAMKLTDEPDAPLVPGDHCRWCPARTRCPAQAQLLRDSFSQATPPDQLSDEEIGARLSEAAHLKSYFAALEAVVFARLQSGRNISGWKLVRRKANRVWNEGAEDSLVASLGEKVYQKKLLSPAAVEKLPGGKQLASKWAYSPEAGVTLAPSDDNRPEMAGDAAARFAQYLNPKE